MHPSLRTRRAFTLLELVVSIAIACILFTILLPVYEGARSKARQTGSMNNMRQIHAALMLYGQSFDEGRAGFGLPPSPLSLVQLGLLPRSSIHTGGTPLGPAGSDVYLYFPLGLTLVDDPVRQERWRRHVARTGGNPVLLLDKTHNPHKEINNPFYPRVAIALWLDGHIVNTRRRGMIEVVEAWEGHESAGR